MKGYESYKISNIEGIKQIPSHWKQKKLKFIGNLYSGLTGKSGNDFYDPDNPLSRPYINFKNIASNFKIDPNQFDFVEIKPDEEQNQVKKGDLFFLMSSENFDDIGKTAVLVDNLKETYLNSFCRGFRIHDENFDPEFLNYLLLSGHYREILSNEAKGFTRINIQVGRINNFPIYAPSNKDEQAKIAAFLDYKTNLIDTIIEKKKRLIELLKEKRQAVINEATTKGLNPNAHMKDSGVEALGEIPSNWNIVKLKQIADAFGRIGYRGYTTHDIVSEGEGAITISPSNMKGNYMTFKNCTFISWVKYEESPEIKIYNDDILMVKTGSTYGKVGIVKNLDREATINPQLLVLKNVKINSNYLFNLLRTNYIRFQIETNVIGSTIPTISQTKILNFSLPLPPNDEIESIMLFIQNQMNLIDKMRKKIEVAIEKLRTYRQSLISEAVTGKIDLRGWQLPNK